MTLDECQNHIALKHSSGDKHRTVAVAKTLESFEPDQLGPACSGQGDRLPALETLL
jgi:hypothetical protein